MSRARLLAVTFASAAVLAGCALISGAADLVVGDPAATSSGGPDADGANDGAPGVDGLADGADASTGSTDGAVGDATSDGDSSSRLRSVTFEDGTLTGPHGGDSVFGSPSIVSAANALAGNDSMRVDKISAGGVQVGFAPVDELFAVAMVRVENLGGPATTLFALDPEPGGLVVEVALGVGGGSLVLTVGGNVVGSGGVVNDNASGRLGLHVRQDPSATLIEVFTSVGTAPFAAPVITNSNTKTGRTMGMRMGVIPSGAGGQTKMTFDNLFLDTLSMPAP